MTNNFIQFRQKAIDWLKGNRDFDAGISLLEESKFKPSVVAKLRRDGVNGREAKARLVHLMRSLIQAWAMPADQTAVDIDPSTGVPPAEDSTIVTDSSAAYVNLAIEKLQQDPEAYPKNIASVIREYADAYKKRDILHKQLSGLPEENSEEVVKQRKQLSDEIQTKTELMERLYPMYEKYNATSVDLTDEDMQSLTDTDNDTQGCDELDRADLAEDDAELEGLSKEELQKKRKSVATKISRAKNMLEFQQETKGATPDPMPESPKRLKYETKINNLSKELERIDYAIAKLG